jgi:hypothetical protein
MDAVGPEVHVALRREIALAPTRTLFRPGVLEPPTVVADSPPASLPSNAISASSKLPVEMPLR